MDYNIITGELTESYREVLPENTADENSILAVATDEKALSGILAIKPSSEVFWELTFAWVNPDARRAGVGATLLEMIVSSASALGVSEITACVTDTDTDEENILPFLLAMHFEEEYRTGIYQLLLKNVMPGLDAFRARKDRHVIPLSAVTGGQWNALKNLLAKKRAEKGVRDGDDLYIVPDRIEDYEPEYSFLWVSEDKVPGGCILIKGLRDSLLIDYLAVLDDYSGIRTAQLLTSAADAITEAEGTDTAICFHAFNPAVYRMAKKLLRGEPEKTGDAVYMTREL